MLYTESIPFEIIIQGSSEMRFPTIIFMNPGTAIHTLESLNVSEFDLSKVLHSFFPTREFTGSKLFHIKKLIAPTTLKVGIAKEEKFIFTDAMIVYNGKLNEANNFSNFIFFTGPFNIRYSYEWTSGTKLPDDFGENLEKNLHKNYKAKILDYFTSREHNLLYEGKFSGILKTTEGQEKVDISSVTKFIEKKAELFQQLHLQKLVRQLSILNQSLASLEARFSKLETAE